MGYYSFVNYKLKVSVLLSVTFVYLLYKKLSITSKRSSNSMYYMQFKVKLANWKLTTHVFLLKQVQVPVQTFTRPVKKVILHVKLLKLVPSSMDCSCCYTEQKLTAESFQIRSITTEIAP